MPCRECSAVVVRGAHAGPGDLTDLSCSATGLRSCVAALRRAELRHLLDIAVSLRRPGKLSFFSCILSQKARGNSLGNKRASGLWISDVPPHLVPGVLVSCCFLFHLGRIAHG